VTVNDVTAPVITPPLNLTQPNDPGICAAEVILSDPIADDNCEIAAIENNSPGLFSVGSTTVTWTVTDVNGNATSASQIVTVTNDAPIINTLTGPTGPVVEGAEIFISGTFTDNNLASASVDWGDGQSSEALVTGDALSSSYTYTVPGSYNIIVTLEDACGEIAEGVIENVEVIGSSFEGFVKGAGFFQSPQGAYKPNPHASGRFLFGFLVKNRERYDHPKGGTIFFFRAGRMLFSSKEYEYLRVNEGEAIYQGTGRVNRRKNVHFKVTAIDGQASNTDEYTSDAIKIKIWNEDGVIYENDLTEIYAGHIWIYPYTRRLASARTVAPETYQEVDETTPTIEDLISEYGESNIMAYPNPFNESINIEYIPLMTGRTSVRIYDLQGRIVTTIFDGEVEEFLPLNWEFKPDEYLDNGVYLLRIEDGLLPQTIRLNYHR
ncbi:MAG: T9SS type A sorting domain-containing protein, partial [Saprospiraceae bacterium]|nr:T9SS type A sorting domain-containing protein [Saprospiraceae bacterium]